MKYYQRIQGTNWRNAWPGLPETVPVTCVSWFDAVVFCKWFGKSNRCKCRLPTEAEWEYACRAGSETAFNASARIHDLGWFGGNSGDDVFDGERLIYRGLEEYFDRVMKEHGRPHPVGLKQPNKWGLHDMHGNVWEWCSDAFGDYPRGPVTNPKGPFVFRTPEFRCARGGDWYDPPPIATSFNRGNWQPAVGYTHVGFRLVREC